MFIKEMLYLLFVYLRSKDIRKVHASTQYSTVNRYARGNKFTGHPPEITTNLKDGKESSILQGMVNVLSSKDPGTRKEQRKAKDFNND